MYLVFSRRMITQAVILAGGLGTRMRPLTLETPKPMILVAGKPFLERLIGLLKDQGITKIVIATGYLAEKIEDHFGDGSRFGVEIVYSRGDVDWETGKRITEALPLIEDEFLLCYGDNYVPFDLAEMEKQFRESGKLGMLTVYANQDNYTKSNVRVENGEIVLYDKKREAENLQGVEIGFSLFKKEVMQIEGNQSVSVVIKKLAETGQLGAYVTGHPYVSISTIERLPRAEDFFAEKKIVLLDRDGVINHRRGQAQYVSTPEQLEFLPGVLESFKQLGEAGYKILIITNQPGIARGDLSETDLGAIHDKLRSAMEEQGVRESGIYYCPHNWDDGCPCRKPEPGMLFEAAQDHHLLLSQYYFVGDDERDVQAGQTAGTKTIFIGEKSDADHTFASLQDAVPIILGKANKEEESA